MKNISFLLAVIFIFSSCNQEKKEPTLTKENKAFEKTEPFILTVEKIDSTQFPSNIKYEGNIKNAVRWKDKLGDNIVITTETGKYLNPKFKHDPELDGFDAELFAYHFIVSENQVNQTWRIYDYFSDCPVDIFVSIVDNTFQITDLDNNGIAEVWVMYDVDCSGDPSPMERKVIMYEGNKKYALRGKTRSINYENGKKSYDGGNFKLDENFKNGPKVFKDFAQKLWNDNLNE